MLQVANFQKGDYSQKILVLHLIYYYQPGMFWKIMKIPLFTIAKVLRNKSDDWLVIKKINIFIENIYFVQNSVNDLTLVLTSAPSMFEFDVACRYFYYTIKVQSF